MNTLHREEHFRGSDTVKDIVIGMSDGLTVPFALAAGVSGAISATHIIVTAGLAEIAAGSIAMGLGGYLAARSSEEHYRSELTREEEEIVTKPEMESREVAEILEEYGLTSEESQAVVAGLRRRPEAWRDFMMRFELGLEKPDPRRAVASAWTIALSYVGGGLIPLFPYMVLADAATGLRYSIAATLLALGVFGFLKGAFTGVNRWQSAGQTVLIGGIAATVAFTLARLIA
jgi:VIT1/CCC1 family predicted Fe2+/Mn2+ transporter